MGVKERYEQKQKATKPSSTGVAARYERKKKGEEIDSYFKDAQAYFKWTTEDYNSYSYDNAAAGRSKIDYYTNDLRTRGNEIRTWLDANKDTLDAKSYADIIASLDSVGSGIDSIYGEYDKKLNYISAFNSAEEYAKSIPYDPQLVQALKEQLSKENITSPFKENPTTFGEPEESRTFPAIDFTPDVAISALEDELKPYKSDLEGIKATQKAIKELEERTQLLKMSKMPDQYTKEEILANEKKIAIWKQSLEEAYEKYGGEQGLVNEITQREHQLRLAKMEYEGSLLTNDALSAPDFGEYVQIGKTSGNRVTEIRNDLKTYESGAEGSGGVAERRLKGQIEYLAAKHMSNVEFNIYNYYYAKDKENGTNYAKQYLNSLKETLTDREAGALYDENSKNGFLKFTFGINAGLDQFESGIASLFTNDYNPSAIQKASGMIREDYGKVGKVFYDLTSTSSNMLPSVLASTVVGIINPAAGSYVGATLLGASAAGNAKNEMLGLGYSLEQANAYGTMVGVSEAVLEKFLGGIGKLTGGNGGIFTTVATKLAPALDRAIGRLAISGAAEFIAGMADEALEEMIQEVLDPVFKGIATGEEIDNAKLEDVLYAGLLGALTGGLFEGVPAGVSAIDNKVAQNAAIKEHGQAILDTSGQEGVDELRQLGFDLYSNKGGADAYKGVRLIGNMTDKASAKNVGKLSAHIENTIAKQNRADIQAAFESKGLSKKDAAKATQYILGELDTEQRAKVENNKTIMNAIEALKSDESIDLGANNAKLLAARLGIKKDLQSDTNSDIINESEEISNEGTDSVRLRDGSERTDGENTEGSVFDLESDTGAYQGRRKSGRVADSEAARLANEGREVSVASLGILRGSANHTVRLVDVANETPTMKKARERAEARGLKVKFFAGDNLVIADKEGKLFSARGYILGDTVLVRADHDLYTADQLMRHEIGHDMIAKGEVDVNEARERLEKVIGKENVDAIADAYAYAYAGTTLTPAEIWEECVCDSLGDMNIFASNKELFNAMTDMLEGVKKATLSTTKEPNQTRGSPEGKASREIRRGRSEEIETMENNRFARLRKLRDNLPALWYANSYDYFYVYSNKSYDDYTIVKKIPITDKNTALITEIERRLNEDVNPDTRTIDGWIKSFRSRKNSNNRDNVNARGRASARTVNGVDVREQNSNTGNDSSKGNYNSRITDKFSSPEEAKTSGKVNDAHFSIEFADNIANNQRKYVADGLSRISSEELEKAIADTAHMVNEMKPYANILPQDKVGKTLVKNGSYDVSVENTTVCIRTLAYNSFVDMVSEKVGRPLTQMESFLVSQKLYEIAKEPQCLYCYVSLDRKAFNEMVIRYTEQRDAAIKAYEEAGKPKIPGEMNAEWELFKDFLDGRKATKNMWDRYVGWLKAYNNGEHLVSLSDISTEAKRLELVESGGEVASQVKDILKYAQSASWAKKQTQYVAYYDEILKLKPAVIRNLNNHYGMRWYSFSDYSGAFIVENMQQITDAAIRGLKGLSYTKDTDFAEIFAPTGMNINISVYAIKTADGYKIDAKQSANIDEAIKLREKYPNVGIVVVATDKGGVDWALSQEWSDVVIPFHTVRTGADVAEFYNWEIFNAEQSDTVTDQNLWDAYVNEVGKKKASKNVYPSEHQNNKDTYLAICEKRGLTPRFKSFLDNPNYMKLVNETRQSESETSLLRAKFDIDAAERSFDKFVEKGGYYEGWYNDGIDVDGEADIVAEDVRAGRRANEVSYGRQDVNFEDVAKSRKTNREHGKASRELNTDARIAEAVEKFGYTPYFHNAGYVLPDGKMLNFGSEKGKYSSPRTRDHRAIKAVYDDVSGSEAIYRFMSEGNIRLVTLSPGIELGTKIAPTTSQYNTIARFIANSKGKRYFSVDFTDENGNVVGTNEYEGNVSAEEVLYDIKQYYKTGETRERSEYFSRELDVIDYMNEQAEREGRELAQPMSNREILANALESSAQHEVEKKRLAEYKAKIKDLDAEQEKLKKLKAEIKELTFGKEKKDAAKLKALREEATKSENRIKYYDKKLLELEAMTAIKNVLEVEKRRSFKSAMSKAREIMHEGVQGRYKTVERNKIKRVAHDLDALLNRGTKERNVKKGVSSVVRSALDISNMLFATDDELLLAGIGTEYTDTEQAAMDRYMDLYEEYHSYDDAVTENKEKRKELRSEMNEVKKEFGDVLERERKRIGALKAKGAFDNLVNEYAAMKSSKDEYISQAFKPEVLEYLSALATDINPETLVSEMSLEQIKKLYKAFAMVKKMVQDSNKIFRNGKAEDFSKLKADIFSELSAMKERFGKDYPELVGKALNGINKFGWNNLRPVDAFDLVGSETFSGLFWDVIKAQGTYAHDVEEVGDALRDARVRHGYKKWTISDTKQFNTADGRAFELTLGERMSIYAYSKREQADEHLRVGGVQHAKGAIYKKKGINYLRKKQAAPYMIDDKLRLDIINSLSKEQRAYVDEMQAKLTEWGEKGNEASRVLYGIDLFTEKVYFPLFSSSDYLSSQSTEIGNTATTASLLSSGMTKPTTPGANNPIILRAFDDVILEHFDKMSKYHAYAVTIDNLRKTFDAQGKDSSDNMISLRTLIGSKYGAGATEYFKDYITDLNGSSNIGGVNNPLEGFFAKSKGVAVAANISVWVQQYFSIVRAMSEVNPRYFMPFLGESFKEGDMKLYAEMKKYAPVAIIKKMGGFDVGANRTLKDYIGYDEAKLTGDKAWHNFQEGLGVGANVMDKLGWLTIWKGVKKEVAAKGKYKVGSQEYFEACGKRMEEVITRTQVYDSVNSKSAFMRSKNAATKYLVSFMGEPTTIVGMLEVATIKLSRAISTKNKAEIGKALGKFTGVALNVAISTALTSIFKSFVYALRDNDEDEKYWEKYAYTLGKEFASDLNPLNYLPIARDIVSIWEGWDIERPDMTLIADLVTRVKKLVYLNDDASAREKLDAWHDIALAVANLTGVPAKNVIRDIKGIYKTFENANNKYKYHGGKSFVQGFIGEEDSRSEKLYNAIVGEDTKRVEHYRSTYDTDAKYQSAVRKALKENDPRITVAAQALIDGDYKEYSDLIEDIVAEGHFSEKDVKAVIQSMAKDLEGETEEEESTAEEKDESIFETEYYYNAIVSGDTSYAEEMREDIINSHIANGMDEDEANKKFESSFRSYVGKMYVNDETSYDEAMRMLVEYTEDEENDAYWDIRRWDYVKANGSDEGYSMYNEFNEAVRTGKNLKAVIKEYTSHGKDNKTLGNQITSYYKPLYKEMTNRERANIKGYLLNAYVLLGYDRSKKMKDIDKWLEE